MNQYQLPEIPQECVPYEHITVYLQRPDRSESLIIPTLPEAIRTPQTYINKHLAESLKESKEQISDNVQLWDAFKKVTNPYEYIHTCYDSNRVPISKYKPLSRAFYKMIELINMFDIFHDFHYKHIKSMHLAEGPGGFMEAFVYHRKNTKDVYHGITLINDDANTPGWKHTMKTIGKKGNIVLDNCETGDGDLYSFDNLMYCFNNYKETMNIITGDGGFDFSSDYQNQERNVMHLIFSQLCFALVMQEKGGTFILKVFDLFSKASVDILHLLSAFYEEVSISKPNTSRYGNSEKYVVCKRFRGVNHHRLLPRLKVIFNILNTTEDQDAGIQYFVQNEPSLYYLNRLREINAIFGQQQLETIQNTLALIQHNDKDKVSKMKQKNIQKCIKWCNVHNIPYRTQETSNIFLSKEK